MARAADEDVRAYVEMEAATSTAPYIASASILVEDALANKGLSEPILTQIEIMLAAHYATLAVERGGIRRETMGDSGQSYQTVSERFKGLLLTRFGQQAIALDSTGTLAAQGNANLRARFRVVGNADINNAS
jgi:hypothetical protein